MDTTMDSLQVQQAVFVAIASFTVLCWDHMITFADEVSLIWCKRKGLAGYLFLLNRYLTPLGFVVNIVALTLPTWSREKYFVRYEGAMATIGIGIAQLTMLLRVYALYSGHRLVTAIPTLLFLTWLALQTCLMAHGEMVPITQQDHACREVYDSPLALSATRAWLPLVYDTAIFVMTVWRTLPSMRQDRGFGCILRTFLLDGTLYYSVICSVNLVLTVMIVRAPLGLKGVSAQLAFLLTVVMTSRVTLNLKKQGGEAVLSYDQPQSHSIQSAQLKTASAPGHHQSHILFPDNHHPPSQCSWLSTFLSSIFSSTPTPSISIYAGPIDDTQSSGGKAPVGYDDIESAGYEHTFQ